MFNVPLYLLACHIQREREFIVENPFGLFHVPGLKLPQIPPFLCQQLAFHIQTFDDVDQIDTIV